MTTPGMGPTTMHGWHARDEGVSDVVCPPDVVDGSVSAASSPPTLYTNTAGSEFRLQTAVSHAHDQEEARGSVGSVGPVSLSWPSCQYESNAPLASVAVTRYEGMTWSMCNNNHGAFHNNSYGAYQQVLNDSYGYSGGSYGYSGYSTYGQQALDHLYSPGYQQGEQDVPQYQQQDPEHNNDHYQHQPSIMQQLNTPVSQQIELRDEDVKPSIMQRLDTPVSQQLDMSVSAELRDEDVTSLTRGLKFPPAAPGCPPGVPCVAIRKQSDEIPPEPVGINVASLDQALARSTSSVVEGMKEYFKIARKNTVDHVVNDPDQLAVPIRLACLTKVIGDAIGRFSRYAIANPEIREVHREGARKNLAGQESKIAGRAERLAITEYAAYKKEFDKVS